MNPFLKTRRRNRVKARVRRRIFGTPERPRLSVYRSLKHIYAQLIDDENGKTLAAVTSNSKAMEQMQKGKKKLKSAEKLAKS